MKMQNHKKALKKKVIATPESKINELLALHEQEVSTWRIFKIMTEFVSGFEFLRRYQGKSASFFGSARCDEDSAMYKEAQKLAHKLAKDKFAIITGGGPGVMEAANKGAFEAKGRSVGLNIMLPAEQRINPFVKESIAFEYFFVRKVMLSFVSKVYIFFPGGYGTLDEMFEIITLIQTRKMEPIPVVLVGKDYWQPMLDFLKHTVLQKYQSIAPKDFEMLHLFDTADEAYRYIRKLKAVMNGK